MSLPTTETSRRTLRTSAIQLPRKRKMGATWRRSFVASRCHFERGAFGVGQNREERD